VWRPCSSQRTDSHHSPALVPRGTRHPITRFILFFPFLHLPVRFGALLIYHNHHDKKKKNRKKYDMNTRMNSVAYPITEMLLKILLFILVGVCFVLVHSLLCLNQWFSTFFCSWPTSELHSLLWPHHTYSLIIKNNIYNKYVLYPLHFLFITCIICL
jgi:hypothetical protein